jgi:hypothetical protein
MLTTTALENQDVAIAREATHDDEFATKSK